MVAPGQLAPSCPAVGAGDEQLVGPEIVLGRAANGNIEYLKDRFIEATAGCEVADHQMDVVDETTAMKFLGFHA